MADLATLMVRIGADLSEFSDNMNKADSKLGGFVSATVKAAAAVGAAIGTVAVASAKMAADFESDMKNVETLLGAGMGDRIKELGADVKQLAQDTGKPLNDLTGGLYQVVSAFGDSADSTAILGIAAKASTAGLANTLDTVNMLAAVTKGYGDTSAEAVQKVSDLAFQTVKLGQTSMPELAASLGKAVPLAATLGVQTEDLFGSFATLTGVTGNTAEVATQMRATLQALINPSKDMAEVLADLGYESGAAMIQSLGLQGTLNTLQQATGGNTQQLAKMFGSVEALNAVLALTGPQADVFTEKTAAMMEAAGATAEAFEIQQQSVNAMMARLKQHVNVAMVSLGEQFLPLLLDLANWVMSYLPQIQDFFDKTFKAIGTAINWVSENVLPMFKGAFTGSSETAAKAMEFFHDRVVPVLQKVWSIIQTFVEAVQLIWAEWGDEIMSIVSTAFSTIWTVIENVLLIVGGILDVFIGLFTGDWDRMKQGLIDIWTGLWNGIVAIVSGVWDILKTAFGGLWDSIKGWFVNLALDAVQWGKDMMAGFWNGITSWFKNIYDGLADFASNVTSKVKGVLGIQSPSKVFQDIGANIGAGLALGIEGTEVDVNRALNVMLPTVPTAPVMSTPRAVMSVGGAGASSEAHALERAIERLADAFPKKLEANFTLPDGTIQRVVLDLFSPTESMVRAG